MGASPMARWQRLRADADLPDGGHVRFATLASNDVTMRKLGEIVTLFAGRQLAGAKAGAKPPIVTPLGEWRGAPRDLLDVPLAHDPGRLLWIGGIIEKTGSNAPLLRQVRLDGDRTSWSDALPAIYRKTDAAAVLEQVLSPFQDALGDEEARFDSFASSIDPLAASDDGRPGSPLDWLAGWLAMELDERWPEAKRRQTLAAAFAQYAKRGTKGGLIWFIKCYANVDVTIADGPAAPAGTNFVVQVPQADFNKAGVKDRVQSVVERFKPVLTSYQIQAVP
jgi:phage tail-like protein